MRKTTEKELNTYNRGFEDGYRTAKNLYKPRELQITTEGGRKTFLIEPK